MTTAAPPAQTWVTAAQVADLTGRSYWTVRRALAQAQYVDDDLGLHSHLSGPRGAGMHFLCEAPVWLWTLGFGIRAQKKVCAACRGEVADPPLLVGYRRRRHP